MEISLDHSEQRVNVVTTGGTIEKTYDELDGTLQNRVSILHDQVLRHLRLPFTKVELFPLFSKDSLMMTPEDRQILCAKIKELLLLEAPIIVLHGTDTMEVSARYCWEQIPDVKVPVVFTGAMRPIGYVNSDAQQNVTEALLASRLMAPGFYVAFHGRVFSVPHVTKNRDLGTFEASP